MGIPMDAINQRILLLVPRAESIVMLLLLSCCHLMQGAEIDRGPRTGRDKGSGTISAKRAAELFKPLSAGESPVPAFPFRLSLRARPHWTGYHDVPIKRMVLDISGQSLNTIAGDSRYNIIEMRSQTGPGLIDLRAVRVSSLDPRPDYPPRRPEKIFSFDIASLSIPPDRPALIRLRFKDATELFALHFGADRNLRLMALHTSFGRVQAGSSVPFARLELRDGNRVYQWNPLTVSARADGRVLWERPLPAKGQPEAMRVVKKTLYGTTTDKHSFFLMPDNGELVFYDDSSLPGKDPVGEILALGRKVMAGKGSRKIPCLSRFIQALVTLEDKRAIPFLIDSVDKGFGLTEKASAVAGLEKFNGNSRLWPPRGGPEWMGSLMGRVYPGKAVKAEQEKWRRIFAMPKR
jgi:hypothetical protein